MVAHSFREIGKVESYHERRYRKLLENVEKKQVFKKDKAVKWKCRNCGYVYEGNEAPDVCPACQHKQSYYEIWIDNY
jgi:rubrerythrin